jgi:hypothetical protein
MKSLSLNHVTLATVAIAVALGSWITPNFADAQDVVASAAKSKVSFPTKVVDSKGKTVGTYQLITESRGDGTLDTALVIIKGTAHQLLVGPSGFSTNCENTGLSVGVFFFSGANCSGNVMVQVQNGQEGSAPFTLDEVAGSSGCVQDNILYYAQSPFASTPYASWGFGFPDSVSCNSGSGTTWGGTLATFDLTTLKLVPPFKLK